jgi:3-deoxy-manno-octulosonate cytidylyltransferase (CMP-KDO synthetase)
VVGETGAIMKTAIVIPARYGSTRFPGKPLKAIIAGKPILQWVIEKAQKASVSIDDVNVFVASENDEILDFANRLNVKSIKTSSKCETGTDRVWDAVKQFKTKPSYILNLQGDTPFLPSAIIAEVLKAFEKRSDWDVMTPVFRLTWEQLEKLEKRKNENPTSSGTTVIRFHNQDNPEELARAIWFSKRIIPNIRDIEAEKQKDAVNSPVFRHVGLYAFKYDALEQFAQWDPSRNEQLEGLEQLRIIENNKKIYTVKVKAPFEIPGGIDTPEDLVWAEELVKKHPELKA